MRLCIVDKSVAGLVVGTLLALGACGGEPEQARGSFRERGLGKADDGLVSCKGSCGGEAPGGCHCDASCFLYGDCCFDKKAVCDGIPASCKGACGDQSKDGCWCDESCELFGDCCGDRSEVCAPRPTGCATNAECSAGEYCQHKSGCGRTGANGSCKALPKKCVMTDAPVCGCDGKTYFNTCVAHRAGANVDHAGACEVGQMCGGIAGLPCPSGFKCFVGDTYPDAAGICVPESTCNTVEDCKDLTPPFKCWGDWKCEAKRCVFKCGEQNPICSVGGCSSQVCGDPSEVVTTCDWQPWYACFQQTSCGNFNADGSCGWHKTGAFIACMAQNGQKVCDYEGNLNKNYLVRDAEQCKLVKFTCAAGQPFFDDCGCGCETKQ